MADLAISLILKADGTAFVTGVRDAEGAVTKLKTTTGETAGSTARLEAASRGAKGEVAALGTAVKGATAAEAALDRENKQVADSARDMARALDRAGDEAGQLDNNAGRAAAGAGGLKGQLASLAPMLAGTGGAAGEAATALLGVGGAGGAAGAGLSAGAVGAGALVAAIIAVPAAYALAVNAAFDFEERQKTLTQAIERSGQAATINADTIRNASAQIAADAGQAFGEVEAAATTLIEAGKYTEEQLIALVTAAAELSATYGGDVASNTALVADAFDGLAKGETKILEESFRFLDDRTRLTIVALAESGQTADAQRALMAALADQLHGGSGSVSGAFGEVQGAVGDYVGALLASWGPIQTTMGWLRSLAASARQAAAEIRGAVNSRNEQPGLNPITRALTGSSSPAPVRGVVGAIAAIFGDRGSTSRGLPLPTNQAFGSFAPEEQPEIFVDGRRRGSGGAGRSRRGGRRGTSEAQREAAKATRELAADLETVTRKFDPATKAAADYAEQLERIARLEKAGKLSPDKASEYRRQAAYESIEAEAKAWDDQVDETMRDLGPAWEKALSDPLIPVGSAIKQFMAEAGSKGAQTFRDEGLEAAAAIANIIGGKVGGILGKIVGVLQGLQSGDFNGVGGPVGGVLTLLSGSRKPGSGASAEASPLSGFTDGIKGFFDEFREDFGGILKDIFGPDGIFPAELQQTLGGIFAGASVGSAVGKGVTDALGVKGSKIGGAIGGAIGSVIGGPIGSIVGGILGSVVGGLFKSAKTGSAAVTFTDGALAVGTAVGNSASFRGAATGLAGNVVSGLQNIAEALGGIISGNPSVSLGVRNGRPVVDTTGANRTRGAGVVRFGKGEEAAAVAFALADALRDGVITGLSAKVQEALRSSTDIDRALREALKVDEIERLLDGFGGASKKAFVDFERQARERLRIAGKYGFDLVQLEDLNARERTKLFENSVEAAVGSLKSLLEELTTGARAPGTLLDRRAALLEEIERLTPLAATDSDAASQLAAILDQLEQVSLEAFGTAGAEYTGDRTTIVSTAQAIIDQATADLREAQDRARTNAGTDAAATAALLGTANGHLATVAGGLSENNDQNAVIANTLEQIRITLANMDNTTAHAGILAARATGASVI